MTKKRLFWLLLILLLLILIIFFYKYRCKPPVQIGATVCTEILPKNASEVYSTQCYRQNEYVVNYPKDPAGAAALDAYLRDIGLHLVYKCPCSDSIQLWAGVVKLGPDGGAPPPPPSGVGGGVGITKNYIMSDKRDSNITRFGDRFGNGRLKQLFGQASTSKPEIKVAIVDSGIDLPDASTPPSLFLLKNSGNPSICFSGLREGNYGMNVLNWLAVPDSLEPKDTDGHGTFINGILTSSALLPVVDNANNPYIGDNTDVQLKLLHVRFVRQREQDASLFDALCGVHYALKRGAKVINASWRALSNDTNQDSLRVAFLHTLKAIKDSNAILVACAGNDHLKPISGSDTRVFPACFSKDLNFGDNVIAVGAWDLENNRVPNFSNEGSFVDIYAPGVNIKSKDLLTRGGESVGSGTSYATPYVSRLVAILLGKGVPINDLKKRIMRNVSSGSTKLMNQPQSLNNTVPF